MEQPMFHCLIRTAEEKDLKAIAQMEAEFFSFPHSEDQLRRELAAENSVLLCACCGEVTAGYLTMQYVLDEGYIGNVAVAPEFRRMGLAERLLGELISRSRELGLSFLTLEVRESNAPARALYEKSGFIIAGMQKNYYTMPKENAIIMTLQFK